jgi:hypothetical protein
MACKLKCIQIEGMSIYFRARTITAKPFTTHYNYDYSSAIRVSIGLQNLGSKF